MFDFDKLINIIKEYLDEEELDLKDEFSGGCTDNQVELVEKSLKVKLSNSYKWFLKEYGSGGIAGINLLGIESHKEDADTYTVVYGTKLYREKYNMDDSLVVLQNYGDYVACLDTSKIENNECAVVTWSQYDNGKILKKADNFYNYFLGELQYMLE